jgi:hypothetical protein
VEKRKGKENERKKEMDNRQIQYDGYLWGGLINRCRDKSGSDRIIPFSHTHPFFGCGAEWILHECGYKCRFFRIPEMVRMQIKIMG